MLGVARDCGYAEVAAEALQRVVKMSACVLDDLFGGRPDHGPTLARHPPRTDGKLFCDESQIASGDSGAVSSKDADTLVLEAFLPYRLSVLSNLVSRTLAEDYGHRFGLNLMEWRVMAILGRFPDISAGEVASYGAMDKVAVSRAVRSLREAGRVTHRTHKGDRRRSVLRLSASGRRLYGQIGPLALRYERQLLTALDPSERARLDRLLERLTGKAQQLRRAGKSSEDSAQ